MSKKLILRLLILVFVLALGGISKSQAMTITPVRYELSGNKGDTVSKEITLINDDDAPVVYYSSFANFEAQGESGSAAFIERPTEGIGTWMRTERSVTVYPGEQKTIDFSIDIPNDAESGGHFGVIFWGTSPEDVEDNKQLAVSAKTGLIVLLSVNGDVKEAGGLIEFDTKDSKFWYNTLPVNFYYRFRNDGGDRIKPEGKIKIKSFLFIPVKKIDANPMDGNILPNSTRKFSIDWVKYTRPKDNEPREGLVGLFFDKVVYQWKNFALGIYSAKLDIAYGTQNEKAEKVAYFFVFPWQLFICLIIIIIIIFIGGKKLIKKYNSYIINKAHSQMQLPTNENHV
ncbi:TPA: hypothetical protein DIC38_02665 [Candidatus Nomurabacteria bacterium]|nr:MAG: hypothetical protein O210_OD1C00001G0040 [Parcubacteria bacterium RAAC4_OD1_1]HCY26555.1 hypothetical protein [Candidatus Nomurabacteria bacterium]